MLALVLLFGCCGDTVERVEVRRTVVVRHYVQVPQRVIVRRYVYVAPVVEAPPEEVVEVRKTRKMTGGEKRALKKLQKSGIVE